MDLLDLAPGKGKVHKHFLDDASEEDGDLMDSNCIQYRVASSEGSIPFRVVTTTDSEAGSQQTSTSNAINNVQAVLASPLNGQFYVIGSPTDVLGASVGQRTIAPRAFTVEGSSSAPSPQNVKVERQGNRRATHNEVERRRRDNINNWIMKLSKLMPPDASTQESAQGGNAKHSQSKGGILAKACEYLAETRKDNCRLQESLKENEELTADKERLTVEVERLARENALLRQQLQARDGSLLKSEMDFIG